MLVDAGRCVVLYEDNLFLHIGRLIAFLRRNFHRRRTAFCRKNRMGHHFVSLLWLRYTLTDTALILHMFGTRRIDLHTLHLCSRISPPDIRPGRRIRFPLDGTDHAALWFLGRMAGNIHFVMLLGEATGMDLITPFLGGLNPVRSSGL